MIRRKREKFLEAEPRKNITKLDTSGNSYFTGNFNVNFDASYFKVDASSFNFIWVGEKCLEILNLPSIIVDKYSFLEFILENIYCDDILKIETYLSLVQHEKDFTFSEIIRLKNSDGFWRDVYMNIVVGVRYPNSFPKQLFCCVIDLTEKLNKKQNKRIGSSNLISNDELTLISTLSKREKEILKLIVNGFTDKEIGNELNISYYTADTHRKNIINKLKVKNTACLAFLAGKIGIF